MLLSPKALSEITNYHTYVLVPTTAVDGHKVAKTVNKTDVIFLLPKGSSRPFHTS